MPRSTKAEQDYEAKGERPRKLVGVRLSEDEIAAAERIAKSGEKVPAVLRRLLQERIKRRAK